MDKITLDRPVIVEGKYDQIKLSELIDSPVFCTNGFRIFSDAAFCRMITAAAKKTGIIILTDSDAAGFKIRRRIQDMVLENRITHVYIPDVFGKEKRKPKASKEGKLGVEGIDAAVLLKAFEQAGVYNPDSAEFREKSPDMIITLSRLYDDGLCGKPDSQKKRRALLRAFGFPERLSTKAMLAALNTAVCVEEYEKTLKSIEKGDMM